MLAGNSRKALLVAFAALAGALLVASAAFACTGYAGRFIVETPTGTVLSDGDGTGDRHGTCNVDRDPNTAWPADSQGVTAKVQATGCTVAPGRRTTLPNGQYTINYVTGHMMTMTNVDGFALAKYDCMNPPGPDATRYTSQGGIFLGTLSVVNGTGETSDFLEPLAGTTDQNAPGEGLVCISNTAGSWGNHVPLKFL